VLNKYPFQSLDHELISKEDSEVVLESYNACSKYRTEVKKKQDELYNTLIGLRTKKKVLDLMPELEKYFPKETGSTYYPVVINPELMNAINNQTL
jgi:hypothetical protein